MFVSYDAAQYRALTDEDFLARKSEVEDLLNSATLPEGVTDEMLYAESDLVRADLNRRNAAKALRDASITAVASGAGTVIATSEPETRSTVVETTKRYTDLPEYRQALAQHITRQAPMPAEMIMRARQELRAATDVTVNEAYSNYTDPLGVPAIGGVPLPLTFIEEVARDIKEYGGLDTKVNRTSIRGGIAVSEAELVGEAMWITDKQVSPWHEDANETFTFSAWQLEYRVARSLLAQAIMSDGFKDIAAPVAAEFSRVLNAAIWGGDGTGKPRGIITDPRLIDGTNGKATIIEVAPDDVDNWAFWMSLLYNVNSAYRGRGEWIMGDGTWGSHVSVLRDDNNRPIANFMGGHEALNDVFVPAIQGRTVNLLDASICPGYDDAEIGDIFAAFGNPKNYTLNTQPGMPLTTLSWDDHDNNLHKTKISMACDGRVTNPFGWVLLKKKAGA